MDIASSFVVLVILSVDAVLLIVLYFLIRNIESVLIDVEKFASDLRSFVRRIGK